MVSVMLRECSIRRSNLPSSSNIMMIASEYKLVGLWKGTSPPPWPLLSINTSDPSIKLSEKIVIRIESLCIDGRNCSTKLPLPAPILKSLLCVAGGIEELLTVWSVNATVKTCSVIWLFSLAMITELSSSSKIDSVSVYWGFSNPILIAEYIVIV